MFVKSSNLSKNEKLVLYGLVKYPGYNNRQLSEKLGVNHSTVTSIRQRLTRAGYCRTINIPFLQNLGCEMLVLIYTDFNPAIPAEERIRITSKSIEVFEELFLSVGETNWGFSLSFAKSYTDIGKINDIRMRVFGELGLLETEFPTEVVFPFEISSIYRFLDFSYLLKKDFAIEDDEPPRFPPLFKKNKDVELTDTEKLVFYGLVKHPDLPDGSISDKIKVSSHTVSNIRRKLKEDGLIKTIHIPDLKKLNYEILSVYHGTFNPRMPFDQDAIGAELLTDSTILMATRKFEKIMLSAYKNYDDFKSETVQQTKYLKDKNYLIKTPIIRLHSISRMIIIKDFVFAPIVKKILGLKGRF